MADRVPGPGSAGRPAGGAGEEILAEIERELGPDPDAETLLELRPGTDGDASTLILFAVEPSGTAQLLAVLDGPEAVAEHHDEAVRLAADVLGDIRLGEDPQATALGFADAGAFTAEFFGDCAAEVTAGAARLAARSRA